MDELKNYKKPSYVENISDRLGFREKQSWEETVLNNSNFLREEAHGERILG